MTASLSKEFLAQCAHLSTKKVICSLSETARAARIKIGSNKGFEIGPWSEDRTRLLAANRIINWTHFLKFATEYPGSLAIQKQDIFVLLYCPVSSVYREPNDLSTKQMTL